MTRPVVPFVVHTSFARPDPALVARLAGVGVDRLAALVGRMYTLGSEIRPLYQPAVPVVGVASTVKCPPGDNLGVAKALDLVRPGDVLVVDAQGFSEWCLGGFEMLQWSRVNRGLAGIVVNGAYRDVGEAREASMPVYAKGVAVFSGPKNGPAEINVPVCCAGVVVHPGDVVVMSGEGGVIVPRGSLPAVVAALGSKNPGGQGVDIDDFMRAMSRRVDDYLNGRDEVE